MAHRGGHRADHRRGAARRIRRAPRRGTARDVMWLTLAAAITLEVTATLCLRASDGLRRKLWLIPVIVGYIASFALLSVTLSLGMPVGIAYGVWSACGVALVALFARVLFAEPLTPTMMLGIGLIIAGVLSIELVGVVH